MEVAKAMGTDIHLQAEKWNGERWERIPHPPSSCWSCSDYNRETGKWENPSGWFNPNVLRTEVCDYAILEDRGPQYGRVKIDKRETCYSCKGTKIVHEQWWHDRNYDVFAMLADVRNGTGFAGVRTSSGFNVIAEPRGLPSDLSEEVIAHLEVAGERVEGGEIVYLEGSEDVYDKLEATRDGYWSFGDHTFSWLTLAEIMDFDWSQTTTLEGWVTPGEFERWRTEGEPKSWSGVVEGRDVEHVSNQAMADLIDSGDIVFEGDTDDPFDGRPYTTAFQRSMQEVGEFPEGSHGATMQLRGTRYYTNVSWPRVYRDSAKGFLEAMGRLAEHAPDGDLTKLRIVFGFDS